MGGAGNVIIFVVMLAGGAVWTVLYLLFAAHYLLVTIIDSAAGQDEIRFPYEPIFDRWPKLALCLWLLVFWGLTGTVLSMPCLLRFSETGVIVLPLLLWIFFPISLLSTLFAHHWFFVIHPGLVWRLLNRYGALAYVHLITFLSAAVCVGFLIGVFTHNFLWALPTAFVLPTALLLYARHWGRFAWFALNFSTKKKRKRRKPRKEAWESSANDDEDVPEMDVEVIDPHAEGIHAGPPPTSPTSHAIQSGASAPPDGIQTGAAPVSVHADDEDEWATNKKPYEVIEEPANALSREALSISRDVNPEANRPIVLSEFYDEKIKQEKQEQTKKEAAMQFLPPLNKTAPSFPTALVNGVWLFMIYPRTLQVWGNLVVLTIVEIFFLAMIARFWPALD